MAVTFGVVIGFVLGISRFAYAVLEPPIVIGLYALPKVGLYPIFLFAFGLTVSAQASLAMFFGVFPIQPRRLLRFALRCHRGAYGGP